MTALAEKLTAQIRASGPITVADYMAACLSDPEFGYYATQEPFGRQGDFITAPEVSQMFGELIGVWCVAAWEAMGMPERFALVELGPGRGTLMADLLRATHIRPNFRQAVELHFVETSPRLRDIQAKTLKSSRITPVWRNGLEPIPEGRPIILIANEFFDALPVHQYVRTADGWAERMIGLGSDGLSIGLNAVPASIMPGRSVDVGAIVETSPSAAAIASEIGSLIGQQGGAALIIDYGYKGPATGDTLQAVRSHTFDPVLAHPGEADITAHVDFVALARAAETGGAVAKPLISQGGFLRAMGLGARAERLGTGKDEETRKSIAAAVERLAGPKSMGAQFRVLCLARRGLRLAPFDSG